MFFRCSVEQNLYFFAEKAKNDSTLRQKLLDTRNSADPMDAFCQIACQEGFSISVGELFALGCENSDNQCKSTNGGNYCSPYESFSDAYENFLLAL